MKFSSVLAFIASALPLVTATTGLEVRGPRMKDAEIKKIYEKDGLCMFYYDQGPKWSGKGLESCITYCKNKTGKSGYSECDYSPYRDMLPDIKGVPHYKDDDGIEYVVAKCKCENRDVEVIANEFFDVVVRLMQVLPNIICAVFLSAFEAIIDVGLIFVPGGIAAKGAIKGAKSIIQYAKSAYQNGMDAKEFKTNLVGDICGLPGWNFSIDDVFMDLVNAPDSLMDGLVPAGCVRDKNKEKCRKLDKKPDPKKKTVIHQGKGKKGDSKGNDKGGKKAENKITDKPKEKSTSTKTTSTSKPTSTAGAGCAYCGEFDKKRLARDARYQNLYDRAAGKGKNNDDEAVCRKPPAGYFGNQRRSLGLVGDGLFSASHLVERALTEKYSSIPITLPGVKGYTIGTGKYAPAGDAVNYADITKYWTYENPQNNQKCSVKVAQQSTAGTIAYETDHVFEAQTFARFITWLGDGAVVGKTYKKPTPRWVADMLVDEKSKFKIKKPDNKKAGDLNTPTGGEIPVVLMTYGFGRSDGVESSSLTQNKDIERIPAARGNKNLVLLNSQINQSKGIYFKKTKVKPDWKKNQDVARTEVRRAVGPFQYLAATDPKTKDTMWKKWARVSNWIDLVCHEFDKQYPWGQHQGEPTNSAGKASLRSLWAYYIDQELGEIEANAKDVAEDAKKRFDKDFPTNKLSAAEKKWRDDAFETGGFATPEKMRFPRPAGLPKGASVYGAYGWAQVTRDAANKDPKIGVPVKIA